jgi:hypothetical protein
MSMFENIVVQAHYTFCNHHHDHQHHLCTNTHHYKIQQLLNIKLINIIKCYALCCPPIAVRASYLVTG